MIDIRIYPYLITESDDPEHYPPRHAVMDTQQNRYAKKGLKSKLHMMDCTTGKESFPCTVVGLGYMDFANREDLHETGGLRIKERIVELGI